MSKKQSDISINQKYAYYQTSVQCPEIELKNHITIYRDIFHKTPYRLREDFSGTFLFACEWIKSSSKRSAIAIDIDPEPLTYGRKFNLKQLSPEEKKRLCIMQEDVRVVTNDKSHIINASNFSFNVFKDKKDLKEYFLKAHQSLDKNGALFLEVVGGNEFLKAPNCEERECTKLDKNGNEKPWFTYYWTTHRYNPKTKLGLWSIDIKPHNKKKKTTLFEYDWRIWSLSEIKQLFNKSGFSEVLFYQLDPETFRFKRTDNIRLKDPCWICKAVGIK